MTIATSDRRAPDGALVRVTIHGETWAERLPPAPDGSVITVSFADEEAALVHGDALQLLGYRVVGVHTHRLAGGSVADFLVPQRTLEVHPRWWRALVDQADRAYNLAAGPVAASLAELLRAHARPLPGTPG